MLAAAERTFGRHPDVIDDEFVRLDGLEFVFDAVADRPADPPFVLRPECERCGERDIRHFPLEEWTVAGGVVRAQARTTCRPCRFRELARQPFPLGIEASRPASP